jgi:hypothetical protein
LLRIYLYPLLAFGRASECYWVRPQKLGDNDIDDVVGDSGRFVNDGGQDLGHIMLDVLAQLLAAVGLGRTGEDVEACGEECRGELVGARDLVDEQDALPLGERSKNVHVLTIVGMGGVGEEGQHLEDDDREDFLPRVSVPCYTRLCYIAAASNLAYLELGSGIGRIGSKQLEHVDYAADCPCAHAIILVLQQALVRQFLRNGHERVAMCLFLVYSTQLV